MKETYKEVLAKKYAREANYVIIMPCDTMEELEQQWTDFTSNMGIRQQRLCDDRSLQIYGMTNLQHYEYLKNKLKPIKAPAERGKGEVEKKEDIEDIQVGDEFKTGITVDGVDPDLKDFEEAAGDEADRYERESNFRIIGDIDGDSVDTCLSDLEKQMDEFLGQPIDHQIKSDDKSRELYGKSNKERYDELKGKLLDKKEDDSETIKTPANTVDPVTELNNILNDPTTFVGRRNLKYIEESHKIERKKLKRLNDTPFFTPTELIDMGVHGNDNYYSATSDNNELTKNISVTTWFDSYKEMISQHVFEDYSKEWIQTLDKLYSDFDTIKESGNKEAIAARKQSILDLGWNPEVSWNIVNRRKAADRINNYIEQCVPKDVFIDISNFDPPESESLEETSKKTHKPIMMILTEGRTPVVGDVIRTFTHSDVTHASISFTPDLSKTYSFNMANGKFGLVEESLKDAKDYVIHVYCFFAENKIVNDCMKQLEDFKNHTTHYSLSMLPKFVTGSNQSTDWKRQYDQVCSTFVDNILKAGGIDITDGVSLPSPADLYNGVKTHANTIFAIFEGPANTFDPKKCQRQVNYLLNQKSTAAIMEAVAIYETASLPAGYSLRPANQSDSENMYNWEMDSINKKLKKDPKVQKYIRDDVQESIKDTRMIMYKGETVGMITSCTIDGGQFWYIGEIFLTKPHRGKGIGTTLLKNEIDLHDKIKLQVAYDNPKAMKLYKSLGFKVIDKNDDGGMYVMLLDKTAVNERYIISDPDFENRVEEWGPGNPLWITGTSGDGKSTLAGKMMKEKRNTLLVHTDTLLVRLGRSKEKFEAKVAKRGYDVGDEMSLDYILQHPELPYSMRAENGLWPSKDIMDKYWKDYFYWIMEHAKSDPKYKDKNIIVEGCDITTLDPELMITKPVIILGGSRLRTSFRRVKRDLGDGDNIFYALYKEVKRTNAYINKLNKEKEDFWDDMSRLREDTVLEGISDSKYREMNDVFHNVDLWEEGKSNIIFVAGMSGSGKSTISKDISSQYKADHAELDNLQNAKMNDWNTTGSKVLDIFVERMGGLENLFPYCNGLEVVKWKDIVSNEKECAKTFDECVNFLIDYANSHRNEKIVVEGIQIALYCKDSTLKKLSDYPVIIKMNGPLKTEFRREKRTIKTGIEMKKDFFDIIKTVAKRHVRWYKNGFFMDDWKGLQDFKRSLGESTEISIFNEVKKFPVEFDQEGNLIIYKCNTNRIDFDEEINNSVTLLDSYRNTNNQEGMKYELAKIWYIISEIEKRMKKKNDNDAYNKLVQQRSIAMNVFKTNFKYLSKLDPQFNFAAYYNATPFSDNGVKITNATLRYSIETIKAVLK